MQQKLSNIVVTGLAAISAAGVGIAPLVEAVRDSSCALSDLPQELACGEGLKWGKAGSFRAADFMPPLKARKFDRSSLFAVVAAGQALASAGISRGDIPPDRIGITVGAGFCGIANSEEFLSGYFTKGVDGLAPMLFPNTVANAPASNASIEHGLQGPNVTTVQRFCSAESSFQLACRFLEEGRADIMLTGGADDLTARMLQAFTAMHQHRSYAEGFGEGCGMLVLENRQHAMKRGARILGSVTGINCIGSLVPGREAEAVRRLIPDTPPKSISLSGTADLWPALLQALPDAARINLAPLTGRSLAMGGLTMAALLSGMGEGETGLHLAASPEGPYYAISFRGGDPV